jgi:hypothetical protein
MDDVAKLIDYTGSCPGLLTMYHCGTKLKTIVTGGKSLRVACYRLKTNHCITARAAVLDFNKIRKTG